MTATLRWIRLPSRRSSLLIVALLLTVGLLGGCSDQSTLVDDNTSDPATVGSTTEQATSDPPPVMMQGFYWDAPADVGDGNWWDHVRERIPELADDGFTKIWLPPASKANADPSMGYDPYDYFDLGEYNQKMGVETWHGSRQELEKLISTAHNNGINVIADIVNNHMSGGKLEYNPNTGDSTYTDFDPKSGRFNFEYNNFHPSTYENADAGSFGGFPDLAHANPETYNVLKQYQLFLDSLGFDGWRYDYVKGVDPHVTRDLQKDVGGFAVGEYYDGSKSKIINWLEAIDYKASAFDFPLHYSLKSLCNSTDGSYDLRNLWGSGLLWDKPFHTVTFVSNHDTDKSDNPIIYDKMMAYSVILTHEGMPTVFWKDYYNYDLAKRGKATGIAQLVWVYQNLADGGSSLLHESQNLYVMQRDGSPGLVLVLNDDPDNWKGQTVTTQWANTTLHAYAWNGGAQPNDEQTDGNGTVKLWAPPRGYAVYAPSGY